MLLTGGRYGFTSGSNVRHAQIVPWSQYSETVTENFKTGKVATTGRRLVNVPLKDVNEMTSSTDMVGDDSSNPVIISLPPNPYFRQQSTSHSSSSKLTDPTNKSFWAMNRFRRKKNQTEPYATNAAKRRLIPPTASARYFQLPLVWFIF